MPEKNFLILLTVENQPYLMKMLAEAWDFDRPTSLTLFILGGDGDFTPKAFRRTFPFEAMVRGGCNYTLNSSFVITEHLKLVSGQKNFPTPRGRPPKSGG